MWIIDYLKLRSQSQAKRLKAVRDLAHKKGRRTIGLLIPMLLDESSEVRSEALKTLDDIEPRWAETDVAWSSVPRFLSAVSQREEKGFLRSYAITCLGRIAGSQAFDTLLSALHDKDEDVRRSSALALARIGDPRAFDGLLLALKDPEVLVRSNAVTALGLLGDVRAIDPLIESLDWGGLTWSSWWDQVETAIRKLRERPIDFDPTRSRALLIKKLVDPADGLIDKKVFSLLSLVDPEWTRSKTVKAAVPSLWAAAYRDPVTVTQLLEKIDPNWRNCRDFEELFQKSISALTEGDANQRVWAVSSLSVIGDYRVVPAFIEAFEKEPLAEMSRRMATILCSFGDARAIKPLIRATSDLTSASHYVNELANLLLKRGREIPDSDLLALAHMGELVESSWESFDHDFYSVNRRFVPDRLRSLAREELIRRGHNFD